MKKKKILIASLALTFSLSVGTVFASVNAGEKLQQWYEGRFQQSVSDIDNSIDKESIKFEIYGFAWDIKEGIKGNFERFVDIIVTRNSNNIKSHNNKFIGQIKEKKVELKDNVGNDFNEFVTETNDEIDKSLDDDVKELLEKLNSDVGSQTTNSLKEVTSKIRITETSAKEILSNAISSSKRDLKLQMGDKEDKALEEVKAHLERKIAATKKSIKEYGIAYSDGLIADIHEESEKLQEEVSEDMVNIILNINN